MRIANQGSIYAVGDVTDRVALTPVAIAEGHALPTVSWCKPTTGKSRQHTVRRLHAAAVASVGLTEEQARQEGREITVFTSRSA